jgi:hypothetical protein
VTTSAGSRHVPWYLKIAFSVLDLNNGFFLDSWTKALDYVLATQGGVNTIDNTSCYTYKYFSHCRERYKLHSPTG